VASDSDSISEFSDSNESGCGESPMSSTIGESPPVACCCVGPALTTFGRVNP
jgi:hypothetical protein